jgi:hypothetical protein
MHFGLLRRERGQHAAQAAGLVTELRPQPVLASSGGVALVEDEVDDLEHSRQTLVALFTLRGFVS